MHLNITAVRKGTRGMCKTTDDKEQDLEILAVCYNFEQWAQLSV